MADLTTLRTQLAEAKAARHLFVTQGQITDVWRDGRRIRRAQAHLTDLDAHIADLEAQILALDPSGAEATTTRRRRAAGVKF